MMHQATQHHAPAPRTATDALGLVLGVLVSPRATFAALAESQPWPLGLALYLLTQLAGGLIALLHPLTMRGQFTRLNALVAAPAFSVGDALVGGPLLLLLASGLLYQVGLRQGGTGAFPRLFTTETWRAAALGLVGLPLHLAAALVARGAGAGQGGLPSLVGLALSAWGLALTVVSLRASLRLGTGNAVATLLLSILLGLVAAVLVAGAVGIALVGLRR